MSMKRPPHPGGMLLEFCLPGAAMTIATAAAHLGVTELELADICHERAPLTAPLAVRFAKAFGSTPEAWLGLQTAHDLARAKEEVGHLEISQLEEVSEDLMDAGAGIAEVAD